MVASLAFIGFSQAAMKEPLKRVENIMTDFTYSADDLRELAEEEIEKGNFELAEDLANNAKDTEAAESSDRT